MENLRRSWPRRGENEKLMFTGHEARRRSRARARTGGGQARRPGLRFDLTVPLARYFASHRSELPAVFKRYQIGPVWRAERPQYGRFREFTQCDIDVLVPRPRWSKPRSSRHRRGVPRSRVRRLDLPFELAPPPRPLGPKLGVPTTHTQAAFVAIDKLDKLAGDDVHAELLEKGIRADSARAMLEFHAQTRPGGASLDSTALLDVVLQRVGPPGRAADRAIANVLIMTPALPAGNLCFDPFLARGIDYYTGPVFEVIKPGVPFSIAGGGRFDQLIERLGGPSVPACGFSIGFERIYTLMEEGNMFGGAARASRRADRRAPTGRVRLRFPGSELGEPGSRSMYFQGRPSWSRSTSSPSKRESPMSSSPTSARLPSGVRTLSVRTIATRTSVKIPEGEVASWLKNELGVT